MKWQGALQKKSTFSHLVPDGQDVRPETLFTHTFILAEGGRADEREQPFYTAMAPTPAEAEALAFAVYTAAQTCEHQMVSKSPTLHECRHCGVLRRVSPVARASSTEPLPAARPERRFFGLF